MTVPPWQRCFSNRSKLAGSMLPSVQRQQSFLRLRACWTALPHPIQPSANNSPIKGQQPLQLPCLLLESLTLKKTIKKRVLPDPSHHQSDATHTRRLWVVTSIRRCGVVSTLASAISTVLMPSGSQVLLPLCWMRRPVCCYTLCLCCTTRTSVRSLSVTP